jgi:hypothetical protein
LIVVGVEITAVVVNDVEERVARLWAFALLWWLLLGCKRERVGPW